MLPIALWRLSENHILPSGPGVIPPNWAGVSEAGYTVITPAVVIFAIPKRVGNQRLPSGPGAMLPPGQVGGLAYSVATPAGEILPTLCVPANQRLPSAPAVIPLAPYMSAGAGYSTMVACCAGRLYALIKAYRPKMRRGSRNITHLRPAGERINYTFSCLRELP